MRASNQNSSSKHVDGTFVLDRFNLLCREAQVHLINSTLLCAHSYTMYVNVDLLTTVFMWLFKVVKELLWRARPRLMLAVCSQPRGNNCTLLTQCCFQPVITNEDVKNGTSSRAAPVVSTLASEIDIAAEASNAAKQQQLVDATTTHTMPNLRVCFDVLHKSSLLIPRVR